MAKDDIQQVDPNDGTVSKRRFDKRDWDYIADYVRDEFEARKGRRKDKEKAWDDIDRQVEMTPNINFKKLPNGQIDKSKAWMSEIELPLQAQALEVLTADARRFMFPDTGNNFRAHAIVTDKYLQEVDFQSLILGDETEVPTKINQDNADKLVEGFITHLFRQTDFQTRIDQINAEAFKYGIGVGRARMETKNVYIDEARGVRKETQKIPVLVPCSIRNHYLDDSKPSAHSAQVLGPSNICYDPIRFENLALAASRGSSDPGDYDGGWMSANLKGVVPDNRGYVYLLEMEGDIIVPRKTARSFVIPGAIATIVIGGKEKGGSTTRAVVRFRFRKYPFSSYVLFPYHYECAGEAYPTSPLMKGRPVQILATDAANRLMDSAALKIQPPVGWDRSDAYFAARGGPTIFPGALWGTSDPAAIRAHSEIGGDPSAMSAVFQNALNLYAQLTGVMPARLGAQTLSHTTAYAKNTELQQGAVRTIDYVNAAGRGPMIKWLDMAYQMGRDSLTGPISFFIEAYGGYVQIDKNQLPEQASYDWLGSGGPQDENQRMQNKVNSLLLASKLDQINLSTQQPPRININNAIDEVLREGGWLDLDAITNGHANLAPTQVGPGPAVAAIQNLSLQQPT